MSVLEAELKELIVASLFLENISPVDIDSNEPLFGDEGLALDSIDALEIGVEIQKKYGVKIDPEDEDLARHFRNVKSLAEFVASMREKGWGRWNETRFLQRSGTTWSICSIRRATQSRPTPIFRTTSIWIASMRSILS
jgi:acyl carrier protein